MLPQERGREACMKKITIREVTLIGIMAAVVYVSSAFLQIPIPTLAGSTRLHMGNVMCLLSGMLLGALPGGLAAGIGSMFFDLTNPAYITSAPFTFVFKFTMAWLCGYIIGKTGRKRKTGFMAGALSGAAAYVLLYLLKSFLEGRYVLGLPPEGVMLILAQKGAASGVNALIAVCVSVPMGLALHPAVAAMLHREAEERG